MPKFHVQRSTIIDAAPDKVYEAVSDFGTWTTWSPWLCAEPSADVRVTSDADSVGSVYSWKGEVVGQGEIEHQRLTPASRIDDEIRFLKPFKSVSQVSFEIEPNGEGSRITWHMHGSLPFFMFWMRKSMEIFIGMDYQRGLKMLKEWLETGQIKSNTIVEGVVNIDGLKMAGVRTTCAMNDIGPSMQQACANASQLFAAAGLKTDGGMITIYHDYNMKSQIVDFTTGFIIGTDDTPLPSGLTAYSVSSGKAFSVEHLGSYEHLGNAWSAAHQHARYRKLKLSRKPAYEIYGNDPATTPEEDWQTQIFIPLR